MNTRGQRELEEAPRAGGILLGLMSISQLPDSKVQSSELVSSHTLVRDTVRFQLKSLPTPRRPSHCTQGTAPLAAQALSRGAARQGPGSAKRSKDSMCPTSQKPPCCCPGEVLTACLGQRPHFVHIRLAVWPVDLHHDEVLVAAHLVRVARRREWRQAAPGPRGLSWGAFQVRG